MSGAEIRDLNILLANETPLDVISQYTTADLTNASINELKIIISRINASAYLGGSQPRKYWAYTCSKSGTKTELIDRIVNPNYDSRNKNIRVQELVLEEALQCLETGQHGNCEGATKEGG